MNKNQDIKPNMNILDSPSDSSSHHPTLNSVIPKVEDTATSNLQYDLENILCLLTKKYNTLSKKLPKTVHSLEKKEDKFKISDVGERRLSVSEVKPHKKFKLSSEKTQKSSFSARAKCKRTQPAKSQESGFPEKSSDTPKVVKDSTNRFWAFLDCYCSDITIEDIKILEKWIESHNKESEYQSVPKLGVHYSSKWLEEDILEERKEGSKSVENPKGIDYALIENISELELFKRAQEKNSVDPEQPPLVEKLISALVHENIITSPNDLMTESMLEDSYPEKRVNEVLHSQLNNSTLESRLKIQLIEHKLGFDEAVDDELLLELKRLQALLIPVSKYNLKKKEILLIRAKAELAKQEAQKRIQEADAKIMENYRAMAAARLKGKKMSKKEVSQIRNILDERDSLIRNSRLGT